MKEQREFLVSLHEATDSGRMHWTLIDEFTLKSMVGGALYILIVLSFIIVFINFSVKTIT